MDKSLEKDPTELINCTLWARTKANVRDVVAGAKLPELYRSIIFFMIMGCSIPNFTDFLYYYQIEVTGFTQLEYSLLQVLSYMTLFVSTFLYSAFLKGWETRTMVLVAMVIKDRKSVV